VELLKTFFELCNKYIVVRVGVPGIISFLLGIISIRLVKFPLLCMVITVITYTILIYFTTTYASRYN